MIAIDTNVLLQFLFKPIDSKNLQWQVHSAEALINQGDKVFISSIVIAETEWVLGGVFECSRKEIHTVLQKLASNTQFQFEDWAALNSALIDYLEFNTVELSDCLIARYAQHAGATTLKSHNTKRQKWFKVCCFPRTE